MKHLFSIKTWLLFGNALIGMLLLFTCLAPYIPVSTLPLLAFFSLGLPFLVVANLVFALYWVLRRRISFVFSLLCLGVTYMVFGSLIHFPRGTYINQDQELMVMTYNTGNFNDKAKTNGERSRLNTFLLEQDPDILCLQESQRNRHKYLKHYPFHFVTPVRSTKSIQGIFSKYPIIGTGSLDFPETANNAIYADIVVERDTIRVYNLHLQSFKIIPSRIKKSRNPFRFYNRMESTFLKQEEQAKLFANHLKQSPYKTMVCADLNNTPFSYVYRLVKRDLQDTFDQKGAGIGMTYDISFLPFRIDFILVDKGIQIRSHENFKVRLSDHEPVLSTIKL